jgi:hypothetical protein
MPIVLAHHENHYIMESAGYMLLCPLPKPKILAHPTVLAQMEVMLSWM